MRLLIVLLVPILALVVYRYYKSFSVNVSKRMLIKSFFIAIGVAIVMNILCSLINARLFLINVELFSWMVGDLSLIGDDISVNEVIDASITALVFHAIPRELAKIFMLYLLIRNSRHFNERFHYILCAISISLAFAALDNTVLLLCLDNTVLHLYNIHSLIIALAAVAKYFLFGATMGYYLSLAKTDTVTRWHRNIALAIGMPILLHGICDIFWIVYLWISRYILNNGSYGDQTANNDVVLLFMTFVALGVGMWILSKERRESIAKMNTLQHENSECLNKESTSEEPHCHHDVESKITCTSITLEAVAVVETSESMIISLEAAMPVSDGACISVPLDAVKRVKI